MKLTNLFRREYLLIAAATCAGMAAQEFVSRISSASDRPAERSTVMAAANWESTETYYYSDPQAQARFGILVDPQTALDASFAVTDPAPPMPQPIALVDNPSLNGAVSVPDTAPPILVAPAPAQARPASDTPNTVPAGPDASGLAMQELPEIAAPNDLSEASSDVPPVAMDVLPPPSGTQQPAGPLPEVPLGSPWSVVESPVDLPGRAAGAAVVTVASQPSPEQPQYRGPEQLVRERSIQRAESRRQRLEAFRQMGYSPLRPAIPVNPYFGGGAPRPLVVLVPMVVERESPAAP